MKTRKTINYAFYIRVTAMFLILLCHFTAEQSNLYINMTSQFFNIGVPIFFMLSGFLFGIIPSPKKDCHWSSWYLKRIKRIYVPYEIFVVTLAIVYLILGRTIFTKDWLLLALGCQGTVVGVLGAEQTWFITSILICYAVTPLFRILVDKYLGFASKSKQVLTLCGIVIVFPLILALFKPDWICTMFKPLAEYFLGFWIGFNIEKIKFSAKKIPLSFIIMILSFGFRIIGKHFFDDTILYNRIIVFFTQLLGALCICYILATVFQNVKVYRGIKWINDISFEIYLFHYMFTVGPVSVFGKTWCWATDCLAAVCLTLAFSAIAHIISTKLLSHINKIPQRR